MDTLFYIFCAMFLVTVLLIEIRFKEHIKKQYPEVWTEINKEKMGVKAYLTRPISINHSIRFGSLSEKGDPKVTEYIQYQKVSFVILAVAVVAFAVVR